MPEISCNFEGPICWCPVSVSSLGLKPFFLYPIVDMTPIQAISKKYHRLKMSTSLKYTSTKWKFRPYQESNLGLLVVSKQASRPKEELLIKSTTHLYLVTIWPTNPHLMPFLLIICSISLCLPSCSKAASTQLKLFFRMIEFFRKIHHFLTWSLNLLLCFLFTKQRHVHTGSTSLLANWSCCLLCHSNLDA